MKQKRRLIYTDYYPFHITAHSVESCWPQDFSKQEVWNAFSEELNRLSTDLKIKVHSFVLMSNHYHLLATAGPELDLWELIKGLHQRIDLKLGKKKSAFKAPAQAFRVTAPLYYKRVLKYIYRNPVEAGICNRVEEYRFSTLNSSEVKTIFPYNMDSLVDYRQQHLLPWLNQEDQGWGHLEVDRGLVLSGFKPAHMRS